LKDWLLLIYKVPREPTSSRVYVWRKLKQIGAILLHDSVWVLPASERTQEQLQWLAAEITELKGEATTARANWLSSEQEEDVTRRFRSQADELYQELLSDLKKKGRDLVTLGRRFQQAQAVDFFRSELADRTRKALLAADGGKSR
jgi:hypothetical protein